MTACHGAKGTGTLYSYAQLEGLWINAGGPKSLAPIMAAIAEAESGGCSTAYNASGATGLWQILGAVDPSDQAKLTTPAINAKEAVLKYKDQGLGAWVTYTTGAYKAFLKGSTTPDTNVPGSNQGGGGGVTTTAAVSNPACLVALPTVSAKVLGIGPSVGGQCLFSKSEGRAVVGALLLASGAGVLGLGVLVLVAYGLKSSGASKAAGRALEVGGAAAVVLGAPEVGAPLAGAGAAVRRQGVSRAATSAATRSGKRQVAANRAAARKAAAPSRQPAARKAPAGPQGRHAKSGPNRPARGRHAVPQPA